MLKNIIAAAALCSVLPAFAAGPNLIMDYSFESAGVGKGGVADFTGTQLPGWTATTGEIEVRNDLVGTAEDGVDFVELDSTANSSMSTTFDSVAGQLYTLSFYYSGRPVNATYNGGFPGGVVPSSSEGLAFNVGSFSGSLFAPTNTTSDNVWQQYTTTFLGTGGVMTLSFAATGTSDSYGASLDNVSVTTTVPEPMPLTMMGVGLLGLMGLRKRLRGN
jgi:hypothetical protein